ncbi:MAG: RibD family protein, partial [Planctomycetota bacterium]
HEKIEQLKNAGVEVLTVEAKEGRCNLRETLSQLGSHGVQQLLIEAGPTLITECLNQNLADEARIYIAPLILGPNGTAGATDTMKKLAHQQNLKDLQADIIETDTRICGLV